MFFPTLVHIANYKVYVQKLHFHYHKIPIFLRRFLSFIATLFLLFLILNSLFPLRVQVSYSPIIMARDSSMLHAYLSNDEKWRMQILSEEITPELKKAFLWKEDRFFYWHPGINPVSVVRATFNNLRKGKRTSGASTIGMQVVRLLNPKSRTYKNKMLEMFRALQLDWKFSKQEILSLYLNLVPYGGNIEGVKAASILYFGKQPNHLSTGEIATLTIVPNRPVSLQLGLHENRLFEERNKWLQRYLSAGIFDSAALADAIAEPIGAFRRPVPKKAPHLSYRLKHKSGTTLIYSSINAEMQATCESLVSNYVKALYFKNIKNAMALVVDNQSRQVLAYVGSAGFNNADDGGQVDGIRALRSPGSTLKPLVYALAFDAGLVTPKTIVNDVPVSFSGYEPENYDGSYYGPVSIEKALAASLNVPAIKVLAELKTEVFFKGLQQAGFLHIENSLPDLGLSAALGGCGATLEQLAGLYCTFANGGLFAPLNYQVSDNYSDTIRIVSEISAYMISEILSQLERPDLPLEWENSVNMPKIAWKTGTSYGRKDAWSIGYNKRFTVAVWAGNFSSVGVPHLSGSEIASPLLFRIFNAIDKNSRNEWIAMPENINYRYVCSQSGNLPDFFCNEQVLDFYIPGVSDNTLCRHLKKVLINSDSTVSYCTHCCPEFGYAEAYYPNLTPEIISHYTEAQVPFKRIPEHNSECEQFLSGLKPLITSPVKNNTYYINENDNNEIPLRCEASNDVSRVYWYINQKFYLEAARDELVFFVPEEGVNVISCSDDKGRNASISIKVVFSDL